MVDWPSRRFLELVGTEHPIIQAPMAGAGGVELCVAAIAGGALGSLPCGMLSADEVRAQVARVRAETSRPFALNFFCHEMPDAADDGAWRALLRSYYEEYGVEPGNGGALRLPFDEQMCRAVEQLRPPVVSFHFGLPEPGLLARVKAAGAVVIGNATTVKEGIWLERRGADAIVAQGFEAGGHSGRFLGSHPAEALGLFALLPQVVDAVSLPVIAAGGIADGRGIAAAFTLGAAAVQLGTAYLHTPEAPISAAHRIGLRAGHTVFTNLMTGGLARGIPGRLIDELRPVRSEAPPYPLASAALAPIRAEAERRGEYGFGPMWAGQAAPLGQELPAADLTRKLAADAWRSSVAKPRAAEMEIVAVPAFADNYLWLVHDQTSGETAVVDPGDAAPVLAEADRRGWTIDQVWNTHWHGDHTGGNLAVKTATGARISGPAGEDIPGRDVALAAGDEVRLGEHVGRVIEVPGHTLGHIALLFDDDRVAFVGDTLFAMGCGRLFEGTPQQMHQSLQLLAGLPADTRLYCAHEYTLSNARFAATAEPGNAAIAARLAQIQGMRERGEITIPTIVAQERETNPFVRATDWAEFAKLRAQKDSFRS